MGTLDMFPSLLLYLAVYLLSALILSFATGLRKKKYRFWFAAVAIIIPCILAGLRYGVGTDYFTYLALYESHSKLTVLQYLNLDLKCEWAFYLISRFAGLFSSPQLFFALFAFFTYAPMVKVIMDRGDRKESFFLAFFFLLSSFSTSFNIMRQIAAASVAFFSLKYVYDRKPLKFLIGVIVASLFHTSALIVLPLYFVWSGKKTFSLYRIGAWIVIAAYCVLAINMPAFLQLLGDRFDGYGSTEIEGRNLSIVLGLLWAIIFLVFHKRITKQNPKDGLFVFMIIIGTVLSFTGLANVYVKRIAIYFNYADFILLTQLKHAFNNKGRTVFYILATIYSVFMFVLTYYVMGQAGIFPYAWKI